MVADVFLDMAANAPVKWPHRDRCEKKHRTVGCKVSLLKTYDSIFVR